MSKGAEAVVWVLGWLVGVVAAAALVGAGLWVFRTLWGDVGAVVYLGLLLIGWLTWLYHEVEGACK